MRAFQAFLDGLGYRYQREHDNSAYDLFLAWQSGQQRSEVSLRRVSVS